MDGIPPPLKAKVDGHTSVVVFRIHWEGWLHTYVTLRVVFYMNIQHKHVEFYKMTCMFLLNQQFRRQLDLNLENR